MKIKIEISGITPLLMNKFVDESNTKRDKTLTPREEAEKVCYLSEDKVLFYPARNVYAAIINAGKFHKEGKNKITTQKSSLIPAGVMMIDNILYFQSDAKWEVDSQPVVIPSTGGKIMKHRPRIDKWKLGFSIDIDIKMFSEKQVRAIVDDAGSKIGLGDFRPERKGIYGRFVVTKWEQINEKN